MKTSRVLIIIFCILLLIATLLPLPIYAAASEPSSWAAPAVEWCKLNNLAEGIFYSDYQKYITREEIAMLFVKAYDFLEPSDEVVDSDYPFVDKYTPMYKEYIQKAYQLGIVSGYGNNTFGALDNVTREQMSVMLVRFLNMVILGGIDYSGYLFYGDGFSDSQKISPWARDSMLYLYHLGIIKGVSGDRIDPKGYVTREQAMVIVYRLLTNDSIISNIQSNLYNSKNLYTVKSYDDVKKAIVSALMNGDERIYLKSEGGYVIKDEDVLNLFLQHDMYASSIEYGPVDRVYYIKFNYGIGEEQVKKTISKAKEIISQIIKPGMTDYEKELAIHDYIVTHTKYDYDNFLKDTIPEESYTAYGVLINGVGVCQGYASAMHMLLMLAGIDNVIVTGTAKNDSFSGGHAWNIVKIGGKYYHVDATWDDPVVIGGSELLSHKYFNLSDTEMSKDHDWDKSLYPACN
ncbi:S-layer homology domain-containing protein [Caldanaerobius fijiensis DSM 17918]|uniref:S-layer homology domain-containing protein n=1 Tax=Caldanaerobius fijiensis DSM 17918 TaxID=1121256 RepID=A0A1M5AHM6_9THEO|nr:S-layer homology domain-containing protein [Caldanaerobius fijiensis]SHF29412.1 S-layer homology domain-containing protein [Caldanaerobius fijiensis DSM 17918]